MAGCGSYCCNNGYGFFILKRMKKTSKKLQRSLCSFLLGHAFILVGNGDSSCNVRDYGSYAGGETWCAVYINSNANIAETNGLVCVSSLDIYAFIGNHAVANVCTEVIVPCTTGAIITSWRNWNKVHYRNKSFIVKA